MDDLSGRVLAFPGWLRENLHLIYLLYALPAAVAFSLINPPFHVPDEANHFFRAIQISTGHLYASRSPDPLRPPDNSSGGWLPTSAYHLTQDPVMVPPLFPYLLPGFPCPPYDMKDERNFDTQIARKDHLFDLPWSGSKFFWGFPNTAVYPFTSYLPSSLALLIGRQLDLSLLESFYLGRLFNAFCSVILSALAIRLITRGKLLCLAILSMPMTLILFASLSQDAMLIAYIALTVGLISHFLDVPSTGERKWVLASVFGLAVLDIAARPPYLFVIPVIALVCWTRGGKNKNVVLYAAISLAMVFLYLFSVKYLGICHYPPEVSVGERLHALLTAPLSFVQLLCQSVAHDFPIWCTQTEFTWWYSLPPLFYQALDTALILLTLSDFRLGDTISYGARLANMLGLFLIFLTIWVSLFVICTGPGWNIIGGFQERYILPMLLFFSLSMGKVKVETGQPFWIILPRVVACVVGVGVLIATDYTALLACVAKYYY